MRLLHRGAVCALLLAVASCGDSTGPHLGPLARVNILAGDAQTGAAGTALPAPLLVVVTDAEGNPLPGQTLSFVVTSGGGLVASTVQTNAEGKAQNAWTLGTTVGQAQKVEVRAVDPASGAQAVYATFTATVVPGPAAHVVKVAGDAQSGSIAAPLPDSLQVRVVDSFGNAVPNVTVAWSSADGGALSPASSATRADGTTRAQWTTGPQVGTPATATATVTGLTPAGFIATTAVTVFTNAVVTKISGDGQTVASGNLIGQPLVMTVKLPDGRPVVGARAGFRMDGSAWSGLTDASGTVSLQMVVAGTSGVKNVTAGAFGPNDNPIGATVPFTIVVTPGAPATVVMAKASPDALAPAGTSWIPGTALYESGSAASPPPLSLLDSVRVLVVDAWGNRVQNAAVIWTATNGAIMRPATSVTGFDGRAASHLVAGLASPIRVVAKVGAIADSTILVTHDLPTVVLNVSPAVVTISAVGLERTLLLDMDGSSVDSDFLTWTSSDSAVATVVTLDPHAFPAKAKVTAHAIGTATLTATIGAHSGTVRVTVGSAVCGEATCVPVTDAYFSHFTGAGCTGTESYYTPYNGYDGILRSWDGQGLAGTTLHTVTNKSVRDAAGVCYDAWPSGNTLSDFVTIYR